VVVSLKRGSPTIRGVAAVVVNATTVGVQPTVLRTQLLRSLVRLMAGNRLSTYSRTGQGSVLNTLHIWVRTPLGRRNRGSNCLSIYRAHGVSVGLHVGTQFRLSRYQWMVDEDSQTPIGSVQFLSVMRVLPNWAGNRLRPDAYRGSNPLSRTAFTT